jgi:hypothetical protein
MYVPPAATMGAGVPEIMGGVFEGVGAASFAATVMRNGPMESVAFVSVTVISISPVSPTSASPGVPLSVPFATLKEAHDGLPVMEKLSASLSASEAAGAKEYGVPALAVSAGEPSRTGA